MKWADILNTLSSPGAMLKLEPVKHAHPEKMIKWLIRNCVLNCAIENCRKITEIQVENSR
jgi:hypothetical protein